MRNFFITLLMVLFVTISGTALAENNDTGADINPHTTDDASLQEEMGKIIDEQDAQELYDDKDPALLDEEDALEMEQNVDESKTVETMDEIDDLLSSQSRRSSNSPPYIEPSMNGYRVKHPNRPHVWLIEGGRRRAIPNTETYNRLFSNWGGIEVGSWVTLIKEGRPLSIGTCVMRARGSSSVYVLDHYVKRPIPKPTVFNMYYFDWEKVRTYPKWFVDQFPTGPAWDGSCQ